MAIKLIGNYAKRLGLPGYSSHQFSVSCETELTDLSQVSDEVARLYGLLQESVDREIQQTGFVPGHDYGDAAPLEAGHASSRATRPAAYPRPWHCSDKQRDLILELAGELGLDDSSLDQRAQHLFGRPVSQLNKLSASGLITDLLADMGPRRSPDGGRSTAPGQTDASVPANGNGHGHAPAYRRGDRFPAAPANGRKGGGA